jgi:hypothetical protein
MTAEETTTTERQLRLCKGLLHKNNGEGTMIPRDSFPSDRSHVCRRCQREYDQRRGSTRGASRASRKEEKKNNNNNTGGGMKMAVTSTNNQRKKDKTQELGLTGPGVERVTIKAVDRAVERYVAARDERMELTKKEVEKKIELIAIMKEHKDKIGVDAEGSMIYRHDDLLVTLRHGKDELKVRTSEEEKPNGSDE